MAFYNWAMANGWQPGLTVDRKNNYGNYGPDNCRIFTQKQQARNRTTNVKMTYNGETKILVEWSESVGINYETLRRRLKKGWTPSQVLYGKKKP